MTQEEKAKAYDEAVINGLRLWECGEITRENYEYIFPELKESEDESIRKWLLDFVQGLPDEGLDFHFYNLKKEQVIAWLEKQGEHANFRNKIQIGDKVTRNKDGVIVNLSQLSRIAKKDEKQGEQKSSKWSEEDERMYRRLHNLIYSTPYCDSRKELSDWLKSLKDRVQPKQEWSVDDERTYRSILYDFERHFPLNCVQQEFVKSHIQPQNK